MSVSKTAYSDHLIRVPETYLSGQSRRTDLAYAIAASRTARAPEHSHVHTPALRISCQSTVLMLRGLDSWHIDTIMNFTSGAGPTELLSLDNIREQLIRLEDTIIFCAYLVNCP